MKRTIRLKVYGGNYDGKHRVICAATSMSAFQRALYQAGLGVSLHHARAYGSETGNEREVALAVSSPGTVFQARDDYKSEFKALK